MRIETVEKVVNASDLSYLTRQHVEKNEVAECIITLDKPIAFDLAGENDATSRFVIVDNYEDSRRRYHNRGHGVVRLRYAKHKVVGPAA